MVVIIYLTGIAMSGAAASPVIAASVEVAKL